MFRVVIIAVPIVLVLDPEKEVVVIHMGEAMDMTIEALAIMVATLLMADEEEAIVIVEDHHREDFTMVLLCRNHEGAEQDMILDVERTVTLSCGIFKIQMRACNIL